MEAARSRDRKSPVMETAFKLQIEVICSILERVNSPRALSVWIILNSGDPSALKQLSAIPAILLRLPLLPEEDVESFAEDYCCLSSVKKLAGLNTGVNLSQEAIASFLGQEKVNVATNRRLSEGLYDTTPRVGLSRVLSLAREKIIGIIGEYPRLNAAFAHCKMGNGATATLRRGTVADEKMFKPISVTSSALPYLRVMIAQNLHWFEAVTGVVVGRFRTDDHMVKAVDRLAYLIRNHHWYTVDECSKVSTVPKDAFTDRLIAAEPTGNGWLQQGVHTFLRERLASNGVDLSDQGLNQNLAKLAFQMELSTLDLSNASNSVTIGIVDLLLPPPWVDLLDALRTKSTRLPDGSVHRLKLFSAMGNAFTFELEVLVFYALAWASVHVTGGREEYVGVYGDDIIIPRESAVLVVDVLRDAGFELNDHKSYIQGPFFESCGEHFLGGANVTPFYQKERIIDVDGYIRMYNRLTRWAGRHPSRARLVSRAKRLLYEAYPDTLRPRIPHGSEEDTGFLTPVENFVWRLRNGDMQTKCLVRNRKETFGPGIPEALYALKLYRPTYTNSHPKGWDDVEIAWSFGYAERWFSSAFLS